MADLPVAIAIPKVDLVRKAWHRHQEFLNKHQEFPHSQEGTRVARTPYPPYWNKASLDRNLSRSHNQDNASLSIRLDRR